jgi:hypothetical protein
MAIFVSMCGMVSVDGVISTESFFFAAIDDDGDDGDGGGAV